MGKLKEKIIKMLGGFTLEEKEREVNQALDSCEKFANWAIEQNAFFVKTGQGVSYERKNQIIVIGSLSSVSNCDTKGIRLAPWVGSCYQNYNRILRDDLENKCVVIHD